MKKLNLNLFVALLTGLLITGSFDPSNQLFAQTKGIVTVQSKSPYNETVEKIKKLAAENGMMVLGEIDHTKILTSFGLSMNGISLFLGNPVIGRQLFTLDRSVGISIPFRINIYEDADGKAFVNYLKPSTSLSFYKDEKIRKAGAMLDKKFEMLTTMIAK